MYAVVPAKFSVKAVHPPVFVLHSRPLCSDGDDGCTRKDEPCSQPVSQSSVCMNCSCCKEQVTVPANVPRGRASLTVGFKCFIQGCKSMINNKRTLQYFSLDQTKA